MERADSQISASNIISPVARWWNPPAWKLGDEKDDIAMARYRIEALINQQIEKRSQPLARMRFALAAAYDRDRVVVELDLFDPSDTAELEQLKQRGSRLQALSHPAIPDYLDAFEVETPLGIGFATVQAAVNAQSIQAWTAAGYCFDESELMQIGAKALSALQYLHEATPEIHRAIKPNSILLEDRRSGDPLADYEPAKDRRTKRPDSGERRGFGKLYLVNPGRPSTVNASGTLTSAGTYGYTAPEQFYGLAQPVSDLYSLGAVLIFLATGKSPAARVQSDLQIQTQNLALSKPFIKWLEKLTQADPTRRIASAEQALQELELLQKIGQPLAQTNYNMSVARPKLAAAPQTVYADFKVQATAQELKIHFASDRVREKLTTTQRVTNPLEFGSDEWRMILFAALTVVLVGGSVAYTGSIFLGVWIALLLPACFWLMTPQAPEEYKAPRKLKQQASIRLRKDADGRMRLSLSTKPLPLENGKRTARQVRMQAALVESKIHFANLPVRSLSTKPGVLSPKISFVLTTHNPNRPQKLTIAGTQEEIRWLRVHLGRWLKS